MEDQNELPKDYSNKPEGQKNGLQESKRDTDTGTSQNLNEAIENAQDSNDDRAVEAAGKEGGLRAALAARFDAMNIASGRYAENMKHKPGTDYLGFGGPLNELHGTMREFYFGMPAKGVQKISAFLRDRLAPKSAPTSATSAAKK